jgi:hypothetical protein
MRRGITRVEAIVIVVVVLVLAAALTVALRKARRNAMAMRDSAQIQEIHQSMLTFANEFGGVFPPLPSRDDPSLNHTANIYSMLVMQEYIAPEQLVSPVEVAGHVRVMEDYDWNLYDPQAGVLWDPKMVMHIEDPAIGANGSYAHLAPVGDRWRPHSWRTPETMPVIGTRGVEGGVGLGDPAHDRSPTLHLLGGGRRWVGNLCFTDNHMETWDGTFQTTTDVDGTGPRPDNVFAAEFPHALGSEAAADAFLVICVGADAVSVEDVYDALD